MLHAGIITTDKGAHLIGTLSSLYSQRRRPDTLTLIENTQTGDRALSLMAEPIIAILDAFQRAGTQVTVKFAINKSCVENRVALESYWKTTCALSDLFFMSDDDHLYPSDYLESAERSLKQYTGPALYTCLVATWLARGGDKGYGAMLSEQSKQPYASAGGSLVYNGALLGLYERVLDITSGTGDDIVWKKLALEDGAAHAGFHAEYAIHLATWSPYRWGAFVLKEDK